MKLLHALLPLLLPGLLATACVDVDDAPALGEAAGDLSGSYGPFTSGFAAMRVAGDPGFYLGTMVAPSLLVVHRDRVGAHVAAELSVEQYSTSSTATATAQVRAIHLVDHVALLELDRALEPSALPIDAQATSRVGHREVQCSAIAVPQSRPAEKRAFLTITSVTAGGNLRWVSSELLQSGHQIFPGDIGDPCIDASPSGAVLVGYVDTEIIAGTSTPVIRPYATAQDWLTGFTAIAASRLAGGQAVPLRTEYLLGMPPRFGNVAPVDSCIDVPDADVYQRELQYYPCNNGSNQRWWLVPAAGAPAGTVKIINDNSGLCVDVPDGSTMSGKDLQQYPCHAGQNQEWTAPTWPASGLGTPVSSFRRLSPRSAPTLCVSVDGWARNAVRAVEQRTCNTPNGSYDQRWRAN